MEIAQGSPADWSYPWWPSHLDHILVTSALFCDIRTVGTLRLDTYFDRGLSYYDENISDHVPVILSLKKQQHAMPRCQHYRSAPN